MAATPTDLHFLLLPLMAQGHLLPMVDLARILAHRGATVTIITSPLNANRFKPVVARATEANLKIHVVELQLALAEVGLPEGCESFDLITSLESAGKLMAAIKMLEEPVEEVLRELSPALSCIISDSLFTWSTDVARRFNIPRIVFYGPGCFWHLCTHVVSCSNILDEIESDSERFVLPGLPDRVEVTKPYVAGWGNADTKEGREFQQGVVDAEKTSYGILVNSFEELEPEYAKQLVKAKQKKVWCIGPVSLCNKSNLDIEERGNKAAISEHDCLNWLEKREPGSVVYVCLGSLTLTSTGQAIELGLGLESTNRPFIWCIRKKTEQMEQWLSEEGFEERVKERGLIVHGWAPQILIISHRAIGGFMTHCGWNSTLETVCAGVPVVTWPHFADQFLNEIFIIQVLKIGVRIGVEVPVTFTEQENLAVLVNKDDVKSSIESLMEESEEGIERRRRVRELGELAKSAMEEGGSSHLNIASFIQDIIQQLTNNTKSC